MGSDPWHTDDGIEVTLPDWVAELREHQDTAIDEVVDAFSRVDVVFLDAPTGSGKSLAAEVVRQRMQARAVYICSSISLQHQFCNDFSYAKLLKGRANYATQLMEWPEYNASDCTKSKGADDCMWCETRKDCPYETAKADALSSDLAVLNSRYFLTEANHVGGLAGRGLVIADECDMLEGELMSFTEFKVSETRLRRLGLTAPKKGSRLATIGVWILRDLIPAVHRATRPAVQDTIRQVREKKNLAELAKEAERVAHELHDNSENWVRDNDAGPMVLKPIRVDGYGPKYLWPHGKKWLLMSATIISADEMAASLGLNKAYETVSVPMTFPKENREIIVAGVANMANKHQETEWPKMARGLQRVLDRHPDDRVLVHCVSYKLTEYLADALADTGRTVIRYRTASDRDGALRDLRRSSGGVLLAPSFERGVDLADGDCRVVVVAKVPFPNLGDQQVSARLHSDGGQQWYSVATVRSLVQMTGRAVRSEDDWAVTYVLDQQFINNVYKKNKFLLPAWWREGLRLDFPVPELTR